MTAKTDLREFFLRLKKAHPNKAMRLGTHFVTNVWQKLMLNKKEVEILTKTKEGKTWFDFSVDAPEQYTEIEAAKAKKAKKKADKQKDK